MFRLAAMLYSLIATALAGSAVIAVLAAGFVTAAAIISAAFAGAVVAMPVAYVIAKKLYRSAA